MSGEKNREIARAWLAAWNARDLDRLLALYSEDAVHTSPKLRVKRPETKGEVRGKRALRDWWQDSFDRLPGLRYEEIALTSDDSRVFMEYVRRAPGDADMVVAEVLEVQQGKIVASRVYHG
ncbi:nuclear transport factor 2 family protein [bacterium]|nr:nuclear transport factor 2 family protein [bacterium]